MKEFPQNKYILSHLEKLEKGKITETYCKDHKRPLALYCTESKCRKSLCAMCYIDDHKNHNVTDLVQEAQRCKQMVTNDIDTKLKVIAKHRELLKTARRTIDEITQNSLTEISRRKKCLIDQIQSEFQLLSLIITSHRDKEHQKLEELDEKGLRLANNLQVICSSSNISIIENYQTNMDTRSRTSDPNHLR